MRTKSIFACCAIALVFAVVQAVIAGGPEAVRTDAGLLTPAAVYGSGVYGGYFGAAQGVLLLGILGVLPPRICSARTP